MSKRKRSDIYWKESVHTSLSYPFLALATGIQLVLGLRRLDTLFGQLCIVEFLFGLSGLLILDPMHGTKPFRIYPKPFKKISPNLFIRFVITFGVIFLIQLIFQIVPMITSTEFAIAVAFAAPLEEYFFRGIIMEPAFRLGRKSKQKFIVMRYKKKPPKEMSYIELGGIILSGCVFALFHVNYYSQPRLMAMVLVGGWWLALVYFWNKDLTSVILSHFLLNIIFIYQYYQVML